MYILFSPSETKTKGGDGKPFSKEDFLFPKLFSKRESAIEKYVEFVLNASDKKLSKFFGLKDPKQFEDLKKDIRKLPTKKAILRYSGVAYDYLQYEKLGQKAQNYIDKNTIIFSNLFGPIKADTPLPEYKMKQGEGIENCKTEIFYKEYFTEPLDKMLKDEIYLDLRAGFYDKFYKPSTPYITLKFLKNGKVVSHWAKAYRGIVLREMAKQNIHAKDELMNLNIDKLTVLELIERKHKSEIIYQIE